jgi:hypothetical protein
MKDHELAESVKALIQAESDVKAECQKFASEDHDAESLHTLQAAIKSKDGCIFELNKIFELLN